MSQAFGEIFRMASETRASETEEPGLKPSHDSMLKVSLKLWENFPKVKRIFRTFFKMGLRIGVLIQNEGPYVNHQ